MQITKDIIEEEIQHLYYATGANSFFEPPLVAFASADDNWFETFKSLIGPDHWTPQEALNLADKTATAKTVISFVLPVAQIAREENRRETKKPGYHWARTRSFGDQALQNVRNQLARFLQEQGHPAVAPFMLDDYGKSLQRLQSRWSERHVAFVAGLGTFGLSGGLITERGVAHRLGSVVTQWETKPTARPYGDDPTAWCLKCGKCARRCPADSIGKSLLERDKQKCLDYQKNLFPAQTRLETYGWMDFGIGCGLCQTDVPCEFKRP